MKTSKAQNNESIKTAPHYINRVTLAGHLGNAPEMREGCAVLSLATKRFWLKNDEWKEETEWHRVVAWGQLGEAVKSFAKGQYVLVEGQFKSHEYDKPVKAGRSNVTVKVRVWEIRASSIRKLVQKEKAEVAA